MTQRAFPEKIFMLKTHKNNTLSETFFKPIFDLYPQSDRRYRCHDISDLDYLMLGIHRCLSQANSGHDFVQQLGDEEVYDLTVSEFFKALKSKRRLENITSVNTLLSQTVKERIHDPFAEFEELKKWEIYAVDGHYQKAACHDTPYQNSKGGLTKAAVGHFFRLNLRTHHMSLLDTAESHLTSGKKKEHDMAIIKRSSADALRYGEPKGKKVMLVWDRACIDYHAWYKMKAQSGVYFVTIEKDNSTLATQSEDMCDHTDSRNEGVQRDEYVGMSNGVQMRRITYRNPMDGVVYRFITNEMYLPPYLIVAFYKHRWDIEKVYYQFKTKFEERKSWATSQTAKQAQATFQCLLHNLSLLIEEKVEREEDLTDEVAQALQKGRKRKPEKVFINKIVQRATHRTLRFIRWLRNSLRSQRSYSRSIARLATIYHEQM